MDRSRPAAGLLGDQATVGDVIAMLRSAGLEPPRQPLEQERAELARAMAILGLTPKHFDRNTLAFCSDIDLTLRCDQSLT